MGFVTLALSVFLWTTAYKFSLYHVHQNHLVGVSAARMWVDTRNPRSVTDVLRKVTTDRPPTPTNLAVAEHQILLVYLGSVEKILPRLPLQAPVVSLLPSRSPPMRRFCLA